MKKVAWVLLLCCGWALGQQAAPQPAEHTRELLWQKLGADIAATQHDLDGVMGVVVRDLTDGRELAINADEVFPTASCIKVPLLVQLYAQSQQKKGASLSDLYTLQREDLAPDSAIMENLTPGVSRVTNRDLAGFVVAVSDNAATNVLISRVGMENVNRMLAAAGLHQTLLRRKMMDLKAAKEGRENVSTPREMAALLEMIYRAKLLDRESSDDLLRLLSTSKDSQIPRLLPEGTRIANKPGALSGVRNDVGIVLLENRPYVISVMTSYVRDEHAAEEAISHISLLAYRYFEFVANASQYGRRMGP